MFTFQVTDTCEIWLIKEMSQRAINEKKKTQNPKPTNKPQKNKPQQQKNPTVNHAYSGITVTL